MNLELIRKDAQNNDRGRPPILFIHGAYHAAWVWEKYQDFFAEHGYASLAMSVRGHGGSEGKEEVEAAPLSDFVLDVEEVLSSFPTPPIIIGHSLGAFLLRRVLEHHSFPAAVLIGTPTRDSLIHGSLILLRKYPLQTLRMLLTGNLSPIYGSKEVVSFLFYNKEKDAAEVSEYVARNVAQKESKKFITEVMNEKFASFKRDTPVLVLEAAFDESTNEKYMKQLAAFYGADGRVIPGVPHDMMLGASWQHGAETILNWLENLPQH